MSDNNKLLLGIFIGAAVGATIGILLSGDKGREMLQKIKETASDLEDELKSAVDKGKQVAEDLEEKIRQYTATA
jgi:gas vesicle protein